MKNATITALLLLAATGTTPALVVGAAPIASADTGPAIHDLGEQASLVNGSVVQRWTLGDLKASMDEIPDPVQGALWEATATDEALERSAIPIISNLNARAGSGETYRTLFQVATAEGINPTAIAEGEKTSGKIYFDVTGDPPDSIVYNDGGSDLLVWTQPHPSPADVVEAPRLQPGRAVSAPATVNPAPAPAPGPNAGAMPSVPPGMPAAAAVPGWRGTPAAVGSAGAAVPPGWQGTPAAVGSAGAAVPPGRQGTPAAAG